MGPRARPFIRSRTIFHAYGASSRWRSHSYNGGGVLRELSNILSFTVS